MAPTPSWTLTRALGMIALVGLAACEGEPRPAEEPAIGADTSMVAAEDTTTTGVKACDLLTPAEITTITAVEVMAGVTTNDYMGVSQCRFDRPDSTQAVMVSLHEHGEIENYRKVPGAEDVSGIGDAAVWNPDTNQFAFSNQAAVASISFLFSPAESAWGHELARIALARLPVQSRSP